MIWSQIKFPPFDFSGLQIIGEFENRPSTTRFSTFFLAWKQIGRAPYGVLRDRQGAVPVVPGRFYTDETRFHVQFVYAKIIIRRHAPKKHDKYFLRTKNTTIKKQTFKSLPEPGIESGTSRTAVWCVTTRPPRKLNIRIYWNQAIQLFQRNK